ncbi:MAG: NADH-quinone oxidoreductase subunit A [Bdellovibrio sp.]|nr:MAG: NADH-quinone oxidoreductase subunit A [Bdellovibrio sp.]
METLLPILFLFVFVVIFGSFLVFIASKFGPKVKAPSQVKEESYECGLEVQESKTTKISIRFYLTAILFILFDIEIIFMYPWAVAYKDFLGSGKGLYIFLGMGVFLAIFIYGLFWEIKSKALEWE